MKTILVTLLLVFFAASTSNLKASPISKNLVPFIAGTDCAHKAEQLIKSTAQNMGLKEPFAIKLSATSAGTDMKGRPLMMFKSEAFTLETGEALPNSSAAVTVRSGSCDVVRIDLSIAG